MGFRSLAAALALAATVAAPFEVARTDGMPLSFGGVRVTVDVDSVAERRWSMVVRQQLDFSCGSAAVATLLTYLYERPTDEATVFDAMFAAGDQALIRRQGFSMLDMQRYLAGIGFRSDGFQVTLEQLAEQRAPAIVLINYHGYHHFVVVLGITPDEVLVANPAFGLQRYDRAEFQAMMASDVIFAIRNGINVARRNWSPDAAWAAVPRAPMTAGLDRDGIDTLLTLPSGLATSGFRMP